MKKRKISVYKIKNVDSLSTLSSKFNVSPTEFLIRNEISPKQIYEGNIILINNN